MTEVRKTFLTKKALTATYIYLFLLLLSSLISIYFFLKTLSASNEIVPLHLCLLGSILCAISGCSIYYTRKLYKDSMSGQLEIISDIDVKVVSTIAYYFFRPFFSAAFAVFIVLILKAENKFVSPSGDIDSYNFSFVSMTISFMCGFSSGKFIQLLEQKGIPIK